ncbi:MAG TPA: TIGR03435 family protein [Vicinamibacterales bacterium]|nr:TIGR03435 family protein [Vicinamibacterales bacterium]
MGRLISTGVGVLVLSIGSLLAAWPQQPERLATPIVQGKPADPPRQPIEERPAFEAATVKLAAPDAAPNSVRPTGPNRLSIPSMTLSWLIYTAYGDGGFNTSMRVTGGPDWINKTAFAVEGVASGKATPGQLRLMLQTLLEERFALKVRSESTSVDMLTLVMGRSDGALGPKVQKWSGLCPKVMPILYFQAPRRSLQSGPPSEADDPAIAECPTGYRAGGITLDGVTMFTVAEVLSLPPARALLGTIVADQTGLKGRYTLELDYPFPMQNFANPAAPADFGLPSLVTAVQEQWGLRVVPGKGPFRLVVVESAQPPSAN